MFKYGALRMLHSPLIGWMCFGDKMDDEPEAKNEPTSSFVYTPETSQSIVYSSLSLLLLVFLLACWLACLF